MYYKVIKDNKVIDVLDRLVYGKYQLKHDRINLCSIEEAQVILSSDKKHAWHEKTLHQVPVDKYETVIIEEIDVYEYERLRCLNMKTPEEIIDAFVMELLEGNIL